MTNPDDDQGNSVDLTKGHLFQQQCEEEQLLFARNKRALFHALRLAGITHISVEFDGSGDSGQIDAILARMHGEEENKSLPSIAIPYEVASSSGGEPRHENMTLVTSRRALLPTSRSVL